MVCLVRMFGRPEIGWRKAVRQAGRQWQWQWCIHFKGQNTHTHKDTLVEVQMRHMPFRRWISDQREAFPPGGDCRRSGWQASPPDLLTASFIIIIIIIIMPSLISEICRQLVGSSSNSHLLFSLHCHCQSVFFYAKKNAVFAVFLFSFKSCSGNALNNLSLSAKCVCVCV